MRTTKDERLRRRRTKNGGDLQDEMPGENGDENERWKIESNEWNVS